MLTNEPYCKVLPFILIFPSWIKAIL